VVGWWDNTTSQPVWFKIYTEPTSSDRSGFFFSLLFVLLMDGRIKIHRKMLLWGRYSDANTFRVFLHLLLIANHKEVNRRWINIPRWWTTTSMETVANDLKLTKKQIIVAIKHLKRTQEVSQEKVWSYWLITVKNYDSYQSEVTGTVSQRSQGGHKEVTKQEWKKEITKEIINMFDLFWKEYPLKKWKHKAMIAFDNATKKTDAQIIIDWAKLYYNECKREWTVPKYIKRPQWWLNENRWKDIQEDIEPDTENKWHYEWYKRNIIWNEFTDLDWTKLKYKDINYRRFLIYERWIERTKAQELYEKAKWERVDLSI